MKVVAKGKKGPIASEVNLDPSGFVNVPEFDFKVGMDFKGYNPEYIKFKVKPKITRWRLKETFISGYVEEGPIYTHILIKNKGDTPLVRISSIVANDPALKLNKDVVTTLKNLIDKSNVGNKGIITDRVYLDATDMLDRGGMPKLLLHNLNFKATMTLELKDPNTSYKEIHTVDIDFLWRDQSKRTVVPVCYSSNDPMTSTGIVCYDTSSFIYPSNNCSRDIHLYYKGIHNPGYIPRFPSGCDVAIGLLPKANVNIKTIITCDHPDVSIEPTPYTGVFNSSTATSHDDPNDGPYKNSNFFKKLYLKNVMWSGNQLTYSIAKGLIYLYWKVRASKPVKNVEFTFTNPDNGETEKMTIDFDLPPFLVLVDNGANLETRYPDKGNKYASKYVVDAEVTSARDDFIVSPCDFGIHERLRSINSLYVDKVDNDLNNIRKVVGTDIPLCRNVTGYFSGTPTYKFTFPSVPLGTRLQFDVPPGHYEGLRFFVVDMKMLAESFMVEDLSTDKNPLTKSFTIQTQPKTFTIVPDSRDVKDASGNYRYPYVTIFKIGEDKGKDQHGCDIVDMDKLITPLGFVTDRFVVDCNGDEYEVNIKPRPLVYHAIVKDLKTKTYKRTFEDFRVGNKLEVIFNGHPKLKGKLNVDGKEITFTNGEGHPYIVSVICSYKNKVSILPVERIKGNSSDINKAWYIKLPTLDKPGNVILEPVLSSDKDKSGQFYKPGLKFTLTIKPLDPPIRTDLDTYILDM